jgi:hypothetical protein
MHADRRAPIPFGLDLASLVLEASKGLPLRHLGQVASLQVEKVFAESPKVTVTIRPL